MREAPDVITPGRHRPLLQDVWDEATVRAVIEDVAADAVANCHPDTFWPAHPSDDGKVDVLALVIMADRSASTLLSMP